MTEIAKTEPTSSRNMCRYCERLGEDGYGANINYDDSWTDLFHLYKDNDGKYRIACYADQSSPINKCPMCGRNLCEQK